MNSNIPIIRLRLSQTNRPIETVDYWQKDNGMDLNAPYQRGDVWGEVRQRNLIKSILLGIPIPSIIINDRFSAGWSDTVSCAVIDGKQRITTILKFLSGDLKVSGTWFGLDGDVSFLDLPRNIQRGIKNTPLAFTEGQLGSLEEEKEVFELVNYGGVPQGETDFSDKNTLY